MKLLSYLREANLKQADFAGRVGVTEAAVSRWCNGKGRPSWDVLARIASVTGGAVTAADFMPDAAPGQAAAVAVPAAE
jgi:transcriptional regulator with XRE-family HTH domain